MSDTATLVMSAVLPPTQTLPMSFGTMLIERHSQATGYQRRHVCCIIQTQNDTSQHNNGRGQSMEEDILRLINTNNSELSWYQLDRALKKERTDDT
jgi:hypothetical protein